MKFLAGLLSGLLALALIQTGFSFVLDQTLLSAHYLEAQAAKTNFYTNLATALPEQIASGNGGTAEEQAVIKQKLATIITPAVIQAHVVPALNATEAFYKGASVSPATIDLSDLADQARVAGLDIPADQFNQKVVLTPTGTPAKSVIRNFEAAKLIGLVAAVLLFAALMALLFYHRRVGPIVSALVVPAVLFALVAVGLLKLPGLVNTNFKLNDQAQALEPTVRQLINSIAHGLGLRFLVVVITLLVLIGLVVLVRWLLERHKPSGVAKPVKPIAPQSGSAAKKS